MKNLSSYQVLLLPEIWLLKCQKWFIFLFSADGSKKSQFGQNIYVHLKDLIYLFQKMLLVIGFWATISKMSTIAKKQQKKWFRYFLMTQQFSYISTANISRMVT